MKWHSPRLSRLAQIIRGVSFDSSEASPTPIAGHVPILRAGNIGRDLDTENDLIWVPAARVSDEQRLKAGDIAIAMSSGSSNIVGKTAQLNQAWDGSVGAFCAIIRPLETVSAAYLGYWLLGPTFTAWRQSQCMGLNIKNLRKAEIECLEIPLPPPSEQHRIVEILDQADALRRKRAEADAKAGRILPALFYKMFGDPATNPKGWPVVPISKLVEPIERRDPSVQPEEPFTYIDIASVNGQLGVITDTKALMGAEAPSRARQIVRANDAIISTVRPYLRATALVPTQHDNQICSTGFCVLRAKTGVGFGFLYALSRLQWFTDQLNARARGASYPAVTDADVLNLRVPRQTDRETLQIFDRQVLDVLVQQDKRRGVACRLGVLFETLLHRAFTGDLMAGWREAHMNELQIEMESQARMLKGGDE